MRWLGISLLAGVFSLGAVAADTAPQDYVPAESTLSSALQEPVISPIPMPAQVTVLIADLNAKPGAVPVKRVKVAKAKPLPKSILSRSERNQLAILAPKAKSATPVPQDIHDNEDSGSGAEDLDFHRSFSRPQVAKVSDQDQDEDGFVLSAEAKLRLFLARMKAVEVHALAVAANDSATDGLITWSVAERLAQARALAVERHRQTHS